MVEFQRPPGVPPSANTRFGDAVAQSGQRPSPSTTTNHQPRLGYPDSRQTDRATTKHNQGEFPSRSPMAERRAGNQTLSKRSVRQPVLLILLLAAVVGLAVLASIVLLQSLRSNDGQNAAALAPDNPVMIDGDDEASPAPDSQAAPIGGIDPVPAAPTTTTPTPDPNKLVIGLDDSQFYISGVVANQETADLLVKRTSESYGQWGSSNIEVDPTLTPQGWIDSVESLIPTFWTSLLDGQLEITETETSIVGRVPTEASKTTYLDLLAELGFPDVVATIEVVELQAPSVDASRGPDGVVRLTGAVPNEQVRAEISSGVSEFYGPENVTDDITIDPTTFARFSLKHFADDIIAFDPFDEFSVGIEQDQFYGTFEIGGSFDTASSDLTPEFGSKLAGLPPLFARSRWPITITGFTDSEGSATDNERLAGSRAQAVGDYFVSQGLSSERLNIVAKGEQDPIASNDTPEGRAKNRRVLLTIGATSN